MSKKQAKITHLDDRRLALDTCLDLFLGDSDVQITTLEFDIDRERDVQLPMDCVHL